MDRGREAGAVTEVATASERELVVTRVFDGPARLVFRAWTTPELFVRWWASETITGVPVLSCEMDVRKGGSYRLVFGHSAEQSMAFFGSYLEVDPPTRLVWTNEEAPDGAVSSVTLEERDGRTHMTLRDLYPSREALEAAVASGSTSAFDQQFALLDGVLVELGAAAA